MSRLVPCDDPYLRAEEPMGSPVPFRNRPERTYVETNMWTWEEQVYLFPEKWAWWAQLPL